jgi:drug/metabolite transporter (DMT)-like permease
MVVGSVPLWLLWTGAVWPVTVAPGYLWPALGSAVANLGANLAYLQAIRLSGLGATIPLLSLTPVFATLLSIPMLGEVPGVREWIGIVVVVLGAFWLQLAGAPEGSRGLAGWWGRIRQEPGGLWMALVALLWSLTLPLDKLAIEASHSAFHGLVLHLALALALLPLLSRAERGWMGRLGERRWLLLASILCGAVALATQLLALERVWAGFVETLKRGIGSAAALLLGGLVLGEKITPSRVGAVAMMALGVAVILL